MSTIVVIVFCILILIAYLFDISSKYTRIPSVILLLLLGFLMQQFTIFINFKVPDLNPLLPVLGTIGLILIVLEGSLELELSRDRKKLILNSFWMSLIPLLLLAVFVAFMFYTKSNYSFTDCLLNAIPLAIISSAIAIPSVRNLARNNKEFIVYESSFSDVLGVILFNFLAANEVINGAALFDFGLQFIIILVMSLVSTALLAILMNKVKHHIKFMPIIIIVILIYEISKVYHLPGLIFILIFGIFLGNIALLKRFDWIEKLKPDKLIREVEKFKELAAESAFMIRASFFLLFGFLIQANEILNPNSILLSFIIFFAIILLRLLFLFIFKLPILPLLFIAPRGLITILLFLSIPATRYIPFLNNSLLIQIIILTALFMMIGMMITGSKKKLKPEKEEEVKDPIVE